MRQTKGVSKRKNRREAVAVLGAVGISVSLASGASAANAVPSRPIAPSGEITLSEEEVADVSLATFYIYDREAVPPRGIRLAAGGCTGCGGCGCGCGCGGVTACSASYYKDIVEAPSYSAKPARGGWKSSRSKRRKSHY
jgi:hypothetical protein